MEASGLIAPRLGGLAAPWGAPRSWPQPSGCSWPRGSHPDPSAGAGKGPPRPGCSGMGLWRVAGHAWGHLGTRGDTERGCGDRRRRFGSLGSGCVPGGRAMGRGWRGGREGRSWGSDQSIN